MTERQRTQQLTAWIKKTRPDIAWFKLGDTYGGHKKPCDVIATVAGKTFYLEIKEGISPLTPNEMASRKKVQEAGGLYIVFRYDRAESLEAIKHRLGLILGLL
jgi:hypothetical protein